jgi:hypothetical protein
MNTNTIVQFLQSLSLEVHNLFVQLLAIANMNTVLSVMMMLGTLIYLIQFRKQKNPSLLIGAVLYSYATYVVSAGLI